MADSNTIVVNNNENKRKWATTISMRNSHDDIKFEVHGKYYITYVEPEHIQNYPTYCLVIY